MPEAEIHQSVSGNSDFRRLWVGLTISQAGSAIGSTALPVVAVTVLHASTFQVSILAALASITTLLFALPVGRWAEFRAKRPAMIAADLLRFAALLSVPVAAGAGGLTFGQLSAVAALTGFGQLLFLAASQANLLDLVSRRQLVDANGRLLGSTWLSLSLGPSVAGLIIAAVGAVGTMLIDAVSYLASALAVRLIAQPESPPPARAGTESRRAELVSGLSFLLSRPDLRGLLSSWVVYAGCVGLAGPLTSLLYLRVLHFSVVQYGLILGPPSLAGFAGSRLTRRVVARFGALPTIRVTAGLRVLGLAAIPLAGPGWSGVVQCAGGFGALLFFSSLGNAAMTGYRQLHTPDRLMARTAAFWSFAQSAGQPVFILAGGAIAAATGVRTGLWIAAAGVLLAAALVPRHPTVAG